MTLYDAYGHPIQKQILDKPLAAPSLSGVRSLWNYSYITGGLTPQRLATLLRAAAEGDADAQLTLAEEMEEKDLHYASVLGTRKRAVARLPIVVEAASDSADDVKMADEVRALFKRPGTKAMIEGCLDGLGKGYSVVEMIWDKSRLPWRPTYTWRDPRFFQYDRETLTQLRLKDEADLLNGIPLPPYKFIVHEPRLKMGIPLRNGLARLAAWTYCFKNFTVKDWVAFCEVFGMPLRVGKYRPGETEDNINILKSAVANLGSDAAAVIPEGMLIEFIQQKMSGELPFERIADWFDRQMSKAILGQTMTADNGSSQSQATVHNEVREDLRDADAEQLAETLLRDLVIPYINLNWGPRENYPQLFLREPKAEDITVMAEALAKLVPLGGIRVEASQVLDRLGFADAASDAVCLGDKPPVNDSAKNTALNREQVTPQFTPVQQSIENLKAAAIDAAAGPLQEMVSQVKEIIAGAATFEEALARLDDAYGTVEARALADLLAQSMFMAQLAGRINTP
ncbi:DUF935 domain-containing protein [Trichlorobacter lovleyi]|uniref:DUF935 domain-containing protein n=1 Tax=Trichlorobacter lovleyi TaxID=313985 RepID=UPI00224081E6|nr:DUF935 domain-containing protein [Trichlorobacter lovleyi]